MKNKNSKGTRARRLRSLTPRVMLRQSVSKVSHSLPLQLRKLQICAFGTATQHRSAISPRWCKPRGAQRRAHRLQAAHQRRLRRPAASRQWWQEQSSKRQVRYLQGQRQPRRSSAHQMRSAHLERLCQRPRRRRSLWRVLTRPMRLQQAPAGLSTHTHLSQRQARPQAHGERVQ